MKPLDQTGASSGPPLASGRDADVFALDDRRVLRRYRRVTDVTQEAAMMTYVGGHGYPVPHVYRAAGSDLVLERLTGPTMAQAMTDGELPLPAGAAMLADLLRRLHEVPVPRDAESGTAVIHLDLHPENVMLTGRGPVVIDWCNARLGPADLDTALSALIIAQLAIGSIRHPLTVAAGEFLDAFLVRAPGDPTRLLDDALALRLGNPTMSAGEIAALPAAAARVRAGR